MRHHLTLGEVSREKESMVTTPCESSKEEIDCQERKKENEEKAEVTSDWNPSCFYCRSKGPFVKSKKRMI